MAAPPVSILHSSATFEFLSHYPNLHMPAKRVASSTLVTPGNAAQILDGEWLLLQGDGTVTRPSGNATGLSNTAGSVVNDRVYICNTQPGRSDTQVSGFVPLCMDEGFEFRTRLHTGNLASPVSLAAGHHCQLVIDSVVLNGTTYAGKTLLDSLETATATGAFVAICTEAPDSDGWARFVARRGQLV